MARYGNILLLALVASTSLTFIAARTAAVAQENPSQSEAAPPLPGTPLGPDTETPATPAPLSHMPRNVPTSPSPAPDSMSLAYISGLQRALPSHGYRAGPQTGNLDPATEAAILEYQHDAGLAQDVHSAMSLKETLDSVSFVKPPIMAHTKRSRRAYAWPSHARASDVPPTIRWVQERLNTKGYDVGRPDGRMGRHTIDAIMTFQAEHGLPRDAAITPVLVDQLRQ